MVSRIWCNRRPGAWSDQSDLHIGVSTESNQGTPILPAITIRAHNSNNVGIGTTNPGEKLHVSGTIHSGVMVKKIRVEVDGTETGYNDVDSVLNIAEVRAFNSAGTNVALSSNGGTAAQSSLYSNSSNYAANKAIDDNTGSFCHTVAGKEIHWLEITLQTEQDITSIEVVQRDGYGGNTNAPERDPTKLILYNQSDEVVHTTNYGLPWAQRTVTTPITGTYIKNGNVGIGTNNPAAKLHINGGGIIVQTADTEESLIAAYGETQGTGRIYVGQSNQYGGGIIYNGDGTPAFAGGSTDYISFYRTVANVHHEVFKYANQSNNVIFNGNIGIGDTSPDSLLHIKTTEDRGTTNTDNLTMLTLESNPNDDCATNDWNPISIDFKMSNQTDDYTNIARIAALMCPTGGDSHNTSEGEGSNALTFWTSNNTTISEQMRIRHDGNVGIGTNNPGQKLQVNGTISSVASDGGYGLHLTSSSSPVDANNSVLLGFSHGNNVANSNVRASIGLNVKTGGQGRLIFNTGAAASQAERMRIDEEGKVTINSGKLYLPGTSNASTGEILFASNSNGSADKMSIKAESSSSMAFYSDATFKFIESDENTELVEINQTNPYLEYLAIYIHKEMLVLE